MNAGEHRIEAVWFDDDAGCAVWRCGCGYDADGYASIGEARYAAAEHQLPEHRQRDIEESTDSVEEWREAVLIEAENAAVGDPHAWSWYRATAG